MRIRELNIFDEFATVNKENVFEAAKIMKENNVPDLVLVNNDKKPLGIISTVDIVMKIMAEGKDPNTTKIASIARKVKSFSDEALREEVYEYMMETNSELVPIVKKDGTLLGVCTIGDILIEVEDEK
ncbi:MAG: CBS domain-containing protein [Promethearchaeota archaeon]